MPGELRLYADLGNTTLHVGLWADAWLAEVRFGVDPMNEDDAWEDALLDLFGRTGRAAKACASAALCGGGPFVSDVLGAVEQVTECVPHLVGPEDDLGIDYRYDPPESLGRDRILGALAARAKCGSPVAVIDAGTFITCDVVDENGVLCPIGIAPGLPALIAGSRISVPHLGDALAQIAEKGEIDVALPATSTAGSLSNGIAACLCGTASLFTGLATLHLEQDHGPAVVLTGGDACILTASIEDATVAPLLVLDGLRLIDPAAKT